MKSIECFHMMSRRPCWSSRQRNGGHLGGVKYSLGDLTLFLCKFLLLFHYANVTSGHMRDHNLLKSFRPKLNLHQDHTDTKSLELVCFVCLKYEDIRILILRRKHKRRHKGIFAICSLAFAKWYRYYYS